MGAQVLWDLLEVEMGRGRDEQIRDIAKTEDNKKKQDNFTKISHVFSQDKNRL